VNSYYIVKIGKLPGPHEAAAANLGGTCAAWAQSPDKDTTEVIAVSSSGVVDRLTREESERRASSFLNPKIR
jgi:hypothetical protein